MIHFQVRARSWQGLRNTSLIFKNIRMTREIPASIADMIAEIEISLGSAFDNAEYSIAVAAGVSNSNYCAFPFAGSAAQLTR